MWGLAPAYEKYPLSCPARWEYKEKCRVLRRFVRETDSTIVKRKLYKEEE